MLLSVLVSHAAASHLVSPYQSCCSLAPGQPYPPVLPCCLLAQPPPPSRAPPPAPSQPQAIEKLRLDDDKPAPGVRPKALGMESCVGTEYVKFSSALALENKVEDYMNDIISKMRNELRAITKRSVDDYNTKPREEWQFLWPSQIILVVNQIYWCLEVGDRPHVNLALLSRPHVNLASLSVPHASHLPTSLRLGPLPDFTLLQALPGACVSGQTGMWVGCAWPVCVCVRESHSPPLAPA